MNGKDFTQSLNTCQLLETDYLYAHHIHYALHITYNIHILSATSTFHRQQLRNNAHT